MRNKKVSIYYGLDYCCHSSALYIDYKLITGDMRGYESNVLDALGYEIDEIQVDQDWINSINWVWPENEKDVKQLNKG